jgi:hypothetical protein
MLDGLELIDKMDQLHEDWSKWYTPNEEELKSANWQNPFSVARDGFARAFDPVHHIFRGHSSSTDITYYYKEAGGNMSKTEVQQIKDKATQMHAARRSLLMSQIESDSD